MNMNINFRRRSTHHANSTNGIPPQLINTSPQSPSLPSDTSISNSSYAKKCKEIMELDRDIRNIGVEDFHLDMPRLTVIGGQSAGKSSLVEAVSGINVPRDSDVQRNAPCQPRPIPGPSLPKQFSPVLRNKKDVEIWLRRAQTTILNLHISSDTFKNKTAAELKRALVDENAVSFSKNSILVDVKDPNLTDLTFFDLPGLIQNHDDPGMIKLVEDLTVTQIRGENTLILVTVPMSDDMENQKAVLLAKDADPEGKRTIIVLTKPDTLTPGAVGSRKKWKDIIEGREHPLKHGYYCVRLPDDDERARNTSKAESQRLEAEFFDLNEPWSNIINRTRFGVPNFVSNISRLLVELIERNIPQLKKQVEQLLEACDKGLDQLPALSVNEPSTEAFLRVTRFCNEFQEAVFGKCRKELVQGNRERYGQFKTDILQTRPYFKPFHDNSPWLHTHLALDEGATGALVSLDDVGVVIKESIGWELPGHIPYEATEKLILKFTKLWYQPASSLFNDIHSSTSEFIEKLIFEHFGPFKNLEKEIKAIVVIELEKCKVEADRMVKKMLQLEGKPLFTQNIELLESRKGFWLRRYRDTHNNPNPKYPVVPSHGCGCAENTHVAFPVMATVQAYFDVAHIRIVDYIPLAIEHELIQALSTTLQMSIFAYLLQDENIPARMKHLMSEDPNVAKQRATLKSRKERLIQIKQRLTNFDSLEDSV